MRLARVFGWSITVVFGLALLAAAALYWASRSESLLRWGVERFAGALPCSLAVQGMRGAFMEPIRVQNLVCENADFRVEANNIALVWSPWLLSKRQLNVTSLQIDALTYTSKSQASQPLQLPNDISVPIEIAFDLVEINSTKLITTDSTVELTDLSASYIGDRRSHSLSLNRVGSEWGKARADATIGAAAPFPVSLRAEVESARLEDWPLVAKIDISGELQRLVARLQGSAGQLHVVAEAVLTPFDAVPVVSLTASTDNVDIASFDARLPHTALTAVLEAQPVGTSALTGSVLAKNSQSGKLDQQRLPVQALDANFLLDMASLRLSDMQIDLGAAGKASGSAEIARDHVALSVDVSDLDLQAARSDLRRTSLNGSIKIDHRDDNQVVAVDLRQKDMRLEAYAEVTSERVNVQRMLARAGGAQLHARGSVDLDDKLGYAIDGDLKKFDPARFGDFPSAEINGTLQARGQLRPEWRADVQYALGRSRLAGVALAGSGKFLLSPSRLQAVAMQLDYGGNKLDLNGSFGNSGDTLNFKLNAQRLDRLDKTAAGQVQASGVLSGTRTRPAIKAELTGKKVVLAQIRFDEAKATISVEQAADPKVRARARIERLSRGDFTLDTVEAGIDGTLAAHAVELAVSAPDIQLNSRIEGGWAGERQVWTGSVSRLDNAGKYPIKMTRPAKLELSQHRVLLGATDVVFNMTELKLAETRFQDGRLTTKGTISKLRVARLLALMDKPPAVESDLVLGGSWDIRADKTVDGFVEFTRSDGDIKIPGDEPLMLGIKDLRVTLRAVANRIAAEAVLRSTQIDAQATAQTRLEKRAAQWGVAGNAPMNLDANIQMKSIRPVAALASHSVTADGSLALAIKGGGTVVEPRLRGNVEGSNLKIEHVANGMFFHDGIVRASFGDDALELSEFKLKGGQGELTASGRFAVRKGAPVMDLQWAARQLAVIQHPELRLTVSGAGRLEYKDALLALKGELKANQGRVELRNRTMPSLGDDVIVAGRESRSQLATETKRANLDLKLDLGSNFTISGRGLNAQLAGQIRLTSAADKALAADGEIRVASGTFEAYGRRLQIEQGVLYFAGPVNNPGISIRAMRKNQPVEAGVEVSGTAKVPRIRLISDPEVSDPDKLAWLVLGRQAETNNSQDNRALQSSAVALAAGLGTTPFQRQLAQAVGLDEINFIPGGGASQGGVVAVSKQLSDKVYVTQEFGTTAASNTLRVSYQLTRRWAVRTESGETDAVDVFYTFSFD